MALYDVDEMHVRVADPALGYAKFHGKNLSKSGRATRRCLITRLPSKGPEANQAWPGLAVPGKVPQDLLQVLTCCCGQFSTTAFPGFHPDGGGQGNR